MFRVLIKFNFLIIMIRIWTHVIQTCLLSPFYSSNLRGKKRKDTNRQVLKKIGVQIIQY